MVDGSLFDSLEAIARSIRGNKDPFGGIQLILAGSSRCSYHTQCLQSTLASWVALLLL